MVITEPYKQNNYVVCPGDVRTIKLSFAVWLIDDFTGEQAIGNIRVVIKKAGIEAIKNLNGYYIFTDLAEGQYTVDVLSDLYFFEKTTPIDTLKIKIKSVTLGFENHGPAKGATSTKLEDISELQEGDIVEFHNPNGDKERKKISIDAITRIISWRGELNYDFNAADSTILALKDPVVTTPLKPLPSYPFPNNATLVRGLILDLDEKPVAEASVKVESQNINIETESGENGEFVLYFSNIKDKQISIDIVIKKNENTGTLKHTLEEGKTKYLKILYKDGQFVVMN